MSVCIRGSLAGMVVLLAGGCGGSAPSPPPPAAASGGGPGAQAATETVTVDFEQPVGDPEDWAQIGELDGVFAAEMPGRPQRSVDRQATAKGPAKFQIWRSTFAGISWMFVVSEYPPAVFSREGDPAAFLTRLADAWRTRQPTASQGQTRSFERGEHPAVECRFTFAPDGEPGDDAEDPPGRAIDRHLLAGGRVYSLLVEVPDSVHARHAAGIERLVERFWQSLEVRPDRYNELDMLALEDEIPSEWDAVPQDESPQDSPPTQPPDDGAAVEAPSP
ncbi:MAG TPA: hypothetical protein VML55_24905 [Planctomycetaceae bacterium]|nr:hypothetical protein [Planctomycetaceae bacterium]